MAKELTFDQGYACAISYIVSGHGESTETREALEANGILSVKIAKKMNIDPNDIEVLTPLLNDIEQRRKIRNG